MEHRPRRTGTTTGGLTMASKVQRIKTPAPTLQLHIELRHLKPKIWRRVLVPETITLQRLHGVIQAAFQWGGGHMHEFTAAGERYGSSDPDYDTPGSMHSEATRLTKAATAAGTIDYVYDFGDYWEHRIKIEKVLAPADMKLPVCIAGANAAPPDDCGGVPRAQCHARGRAREGPRTARVSSLGRAQAERASPRCSMLRSEVRVSKEPMPASSGDISAPRVAPRLRVTLCPLKKLIPSD